MDQFESLRRSCDTSDQPRVRFGLTNVHNYIKSWVYNRARDVRPERVRPFSFISRRRGRWKQPRSVRYDLRDHIALYIMGELAYTLLKWHRSLLRLTSVKCITIPDWPATISVHYLIIILINQNNKSYFNPARPPHHGLKIIFLIILYGQYG